MSELRIAVRPDPYEHARSYLGGLILVDLYNHSERAREAHERAKVKPNCIGSVVRERDGAMRILAEWTKP